MRRIIALLLSAMLMTPVLCHADIEFDPGTDELIQKAVEHAKEIHEDQIGYPLNEDIRLEGFYEWYLKNNIDKAMLNNAGDPNDITANHGVLEVEAEVIRFFAPLYGFDEADVWGLISASGTDGNNHGIYFGRHYLESVTGLKPILYVSTESHYSNMRLAELQQIETCLIPTDEMGQMDPEEFREALDPDRPALAVFSMGTTFKGGINRSVFCRNEIRQSRREDGSGIKHLIQLL